MSYRDYSDEQLNAYVDNEMATDERIELLQAAGASDSLRQRLTELQLLKAQAEVVRHHLHPQWLTALAVGLEYQFHLVQQLLPILRPVAADVEQHPGPGRGDNLL